MSLIKRLLFLVIFSFAVTACNSGGSSSGEVTTKNVEGISTPSTVSVVN
ncbi:hypothetical protein C942_02874 [Photobacterium marinum]|uniref:Uncharacterized protein n=1 Tax=Photobacterium marinum TaxID=1056511 RepID=L8JA38_9GAMM|nr:MULTISPECIES: hypothetical protein [Photobacterium]ELR64292.1 hypothetical protein C942_02874 [Photobacterium marinum]